MKHVAPLLLCVLVLDSAMPARAQAGALVEHTFPTPGEIRHPDRTLTSLPAGAAALIVYSPDGRVLATAGQDGVIRIWDARTGEQGTGELLRSMEGHTGPIRSIAFGADGKSLVSVADDRTVRTWDAATGKLLRTVTTKADVRRAILRPGNEPLLVEVAGREVKLWNYEKNEETGTFAFPGEEVAGLTFTSEGKILAGFTARGAIKRWSAETGALMRTVEAGATLTSLAVNGTRLATGFTDGRVRLWSFESSASPREFQAHTAAVRAIAFSPKGEQLASASADKTVNVWDTATGTLLCTQTGHAAEVVSVVFNSNGQKMASGDAAGSVNYWTVPLPPLPPADLAKIAAAMPAKANAVPKKPRRLLVFWRADAILHKGGVPAANHAIELLGKKTGAFTADFSRDYAALDSKILANYDAIVLNSTAHLAIPESAKHALLDFAHGGGGVIGIHAAIDTFKGWPEGAAIVGATFAGHPWIPAGTYAVHLDAPNHPLNRAWGGKDFKMHDELYEMGEPYTRADRRVLLTLDVSDPATAKPGAEPLHRKDGDFAIAWIKRAGAGRVFYGGFGHLADPFFDPRVIEFYLDGIQYALGDLEADATPKN